MTRSPRELAAQKVQLQRDQERLFQDLLGVLDALDHACDHWRTAEQEQTQSIAASSTGSVAPSSAPSSETPEQHSFWRRLQHWRRRLWSRLRGEAADSLSTIESAEAVGVTTDSMVEVLTSAREGVELIQKSLLEILRQRQVTPLETVGKPFDPEQMYALGRQENETAMENTVLQEVVRGYRWQNRILREAQVIVAAPPSATQDEQV